MINPVYRGSDFSSTSVSVPRPTATSGGRRCQSPERSGAGGRGSEHGAVLGVCAARSCTSGIDRSRAERSSRLRGETNVLKEDQPKGCSNVLVGGVSGAFILAAKAGWPAGPIATEACPVADWRYGRDGSLHPVRTWSMFLGQKLRRRQKEAWGCTVAGTRQVRRLSVM
jgi:hypothetical protein